jgi:TPR repeat protein
MEKNTQQKNITLKDPDNWSNPTPLITDAESSPQFKNGVIAYQEGDYQAASREFKFTAEKGNASALNNLGFMYHHGYGVPQDYQTTHMWLNIEAMDGDKVAVKARDFVAKELTTCQLGAAQKMAGEWFAENSLRLLKVPTH